MFSKRKLFSIFGLNILFILSFIFLLPQLGKSKTVPENLIPKVFAACYIIAGGPVSMPCSKPPCSADAWVCQAAVGTGASFRMMHAGPNYQSGVYPNNQALVTLTSIDGGELYLGNFSSDFACSGEGTTTITCKYKIVAGSCSEPCGPGDALSILACSSSHYGTKRVRANIQYPMANTSGWSDSNPSNNTLTLDTFLAPQCCGNGRCEVETHGYGPSENWSTCPADCGGYCTCGAWVNGACGAGGCGVGLRQQTRTCTPLSCDIQSRCVADPICQTHKECQNGVCTTINLPGNDLCSGDDGCQHKECGSACTCSTINVYPDVSDTCTTNSDCASGCGKCIPCVCWIRTGGPYAEAEIDNNGNVLAQGGVVLGESTKRENDLLPIKLGRNLGIAKQYLIDKINNLLKDVF